MTASSDVIQFDMATKEIGQIILNQPRKRNALTARMWDLLTEHLAAAAADPKLKALVITGAGKHFAAGADISEFSTHYATPETSAQASRKISAALDAVANFPRPTIAKIRGACVGGGAGIALSCDMRFSDNSSKFGVTPAKLGLVYPFADVRRLVQAVGLSKAKDMLFSGRIILADEAASIGLIDKLAEPDALDQMVREYTLGLCETSKESVLVMKQMFMAIAEGQREDSPLTEKWFLEAFSSDDFEEGYQAFLEKRKPIF